MARGQEWWDRFFLGMAKYVSTASKDQSTKVGAVITEGNRIVSIGFNGFAAEVVDLPQRYMNRDTKLAMILHGEANAILFANRDLKGCTVYTFPFPPCSNCAAMIVQKGIKRVVAPRPSPELLERWGTSLKYAQEQYHDAVVRLDLYDLEEKVMPLEFWCKVALMGHVELAGKYSEAELAGGKVGRLDIPDGDGFRTEYFSAGAIHRISVVTEAVARELAKRVLPPVQAWGWPRPAPQLPPPKTDDEATGPLVCNSDCNEDGVPF